MKHATSRMLFSYWDALRRERAAPDRGEVEPARIRHILADTFILGAEPDGEHRFRLAGTRCSALFGRDLKDAPFSGLWSGRDHDRAGGLIEIVTAETSGLVAGLAGRTDAGMSIDLELVLLPLRHLGRTHARVLGAISPRSVPSWMGLVPVTSLETRSLRVIRDEIAPPPRPAKAEGRDRFVVLEGGRS